MRARARAQGCDVDICLFDVALHQLSYPANWYLNGGDMPTRLARSAHQSLAPVQTFATADGWIFVMCMMDKFWDELLRAASAAPSWRAMRASRAPAARAAPIGEELTARARCRHSQAHDGGVARAC